MGYSMSAPWIYCIWWASYGAANTARGEEMCVLVLYVGNPCTLRLSETRE
jgi:hypothetical protein